MARGNGRDPQQTRTELLEAAYKEVYYHGFQAASLERILSNTELTKGALYHHFANKEALYVTMMLADLKEKESLFRAAVEHKGSCRDRLRRLTQLFLELPRKKRDLIKLVRRDINIFKGPIRGQLVRAYQAALPQQVEAILRDGVRTGELGRFDSRLLSWVHVAIVEVILTRYAESVFPDHDDALEFVTRLFFNGVGAYTHLSADASQSRYT